MQDNTEIAYTSDPFQVGITLMNTTPTPNTFGSIPYYMFPSGQTKTGSTSTTGRVKNREVEGWRESDYLDYADFENAIEKDEPISFALCQWLMRQAHGNSSDGFTDSEWEEWYLYALEHCPRFANEQPRRRYR
jgi:hypothetical protein